MHSSVIRPRLDLEGSRSRRNRQRPRGNHSIEVILDSLLRAGGGVAGLADSEDTEELGGAADGVEARVEVGGGGLGEDGVDC